MSHGLCLPNNFTIKYGSNLSHNRKRDKFVPRFIGNKFLFYFFNDLLFIFIGHSIQSELLGFRRGAECLIQITVQSVSRRRIKIVVILP